jgi:hypothetical protein
MLQVFLLDEGTREEVATFIIHRAVIRRGCFARQVYVVQPRDTRTVKDDALDPCQTVERATGQGWAAGKLLLEPEESGRVVVEDIALLFLGEGGRVLNRGNGGG